MKILYKNTTDNGYHKNHRYIFAENTIDILSPFRHAKSGGYGVDAKNGIYTGWELSEAIQQAHKGNPAVIDIVMHEHDHSTNLKLPDSQDDVSWVDEVKMAMMSALDSQNIYRSYTREARQLKDTKDPKQAADGLLLLIQAAQLIEYGAYLPNQHSHKYAKYIQQLRHSTQKVDKKYTLRFNRLWKHLDEKMRTSQPLKPNIELVENTVMIIRRDYWQVKTLDSNKK